MRIVIVGAGGHGQVVADMIRANCRRSGVRLVGFLDDKAPDGSVVAGVPVLGDLTAATTTRADAFVVAIGDNHARARISLQLQSRGCRLCTVRHPRACVGDDVAIGAGTMVSAGVIAVAASRIGTGVILNTGCTIDHHTTIGDFVHIGPGVHMGGEVSVGDGALVGLGSVVLPRLILGAGCTVGAGAVVTRDVPAGTTVVGVPARPIEPTLARSASMESDADRRRLC